MRPLTPKSTKEILTITIPLFAGSGYSGVSMRTIAQSFADKTDSLKNILSSRAAPKKRLAQFVLPMRRFSLFIFVVHACLILAAPAFGTKENEPAEKKETTTVVTVYRAQTKDLTIREKSIGWVKSISAPQVVAEVEGRVLQVFADTGQHVKAGELLAKIDDERYTDRS